MSSSQQRIAIIGGGISGLAAAYQLTKESPHAQVCLFEASSRLGGVIQTTRENGFTVEHAADSFIVSPELPWAGELCRDLNLELEETMERNRGALIVRDGELHPIPDGLQLMTIHRMSSVLSSPLLSGIGKMRVLAERFVPKAKAGTEESLKTFATRRYGKEMFQRIIQPLVSGIYTADPDRLSMNAALPQFVSLEQKYGSLHRAARKHKKGADSTSSGARYGLFRAPRNGMETLLTALEETLARKTTIRKNTSIRKVTKTGRSFELHFDNSLATERFDRLIVATPVSKAAQLLDHMLPTSEASRIESVSTAIICLGFERDQIRHPLNAFGFVVPAVERRRILAGSFTNVKFPSRAPADHSLIRVFVGGALQSGILKRDDEQLVQLAEAELGELLNVRGEPNYAKVIRWNQATPQYNLGHKKRVASLMQATAEISGLAICGNAYSGVGIPQCVKSGFDAANKVAEDLGSTPPN